MRLRLHNFTTKMADEHLDNAEQFQYEHPEDVKVQPILDMTIGDRRRETEIIGEALVLHFRKFIIISKYIIKIEITILFVSRIVTVTTMLFVCYFLDYTKESILERSVIFQQSIHLLSSTNCLLGKESSAFSSAHSYFVALLHLFQDVFRVVLSFFPCRWPLVSDRIG